MKKNEMKKFVAGIAAVMMIASLTACGKSTSESTDAAQEEVTVEATEETTEAAEETTEAAEETADSVEDEAGMNIDEEIQAVQDTLVYMGGLKTEDGADKAIDICMFRNDTGDIIYIYEEDGNLDYGMYTTEDATTDDGQQYAKITGSDKTYGYYFNEDLVSGIIVDTEGKVYNAVELDEASARDYVSKTIGG